MANFPEKYPVIPFLHPCRGMVKVPGSKSLSNRSLLLAALTSDVVDLKDILFSRDTRLMVGALQELGFKIETNEEESSIRVYGQGGKIPKAKARLFVGNAGTAARFLTALVALHPEGEYELDGDLEMRERPIKDLLEALVLLGAEIQYLGKEGFFPFRMRTSGIRGGNIQVDVAASSQILSALLMISPFSEAPVTIQASGVRAAFVKMTCELMAQFGVAVSSKGDSFDILPSKYQIEGGVYRVEPDVTAASYFMMLPRIVGGTLIIKGLKPKMLQGDLAFIEVLKNFGLAASYIEEGLSISYDPQPQVNGAVFDFKTFSDTFLTLAAAIPCVGGNFTIDGIAHTRHQETDRIAGMAKELRKLGVDASETEGSLILSVHEGTSLQKVEVETYKDHRFAMSFAILGCWNPLGDGLSWLTIKDPSCCTKTFPEFFNCLETLRETSAG